MKKLEFLYNMNITFSLPAINHHFKLRCFPKSSARQRIEKMSFTLFPQCEVFCSEDAFGNLSRYGSIAKPHEKFEASVRGICIADSGNTEQVNPYMLGLFKVSTPLTRAGEGITRFSKEFNFDKENNLEKARRIMNGVYNYFEYVPKSTNINTTAEEAFLLGKGVCQDYSQVMLSVCRLLKIPCRYVAGLLMGEGETHAWVEVEHGGHWYGFDPTNGIEVGDSHIVISTGRDSTDCSINRGVFHGGGTQSQKIYVKVEEAYDTDSNADGVAVR